MQSKLQLWKSFSWQTPGKRGSPLGTHSKRGISSVWAQQESTCSEVVLTEGCLDEKGRRVNKLVFQS